jgi:hypothetical protein
MKAQIVVISLAVLVLGAGAGGFWAGRDARRRDLALVEELRQQRAELISLRESVAELVQRVAVVRNAQCAAPADTRTATLPKADIESALQRALDRRDEQARIQREAAAQPTNENLEAYARAEQLLGDAVKAKRWSAAQAASFRQLLPQLTGEQADALRRRISVAINEGQVSVQTEGPPF